MLLKMMSIDIHYKICSKSARGAYDYPTYAIIDRKGIVRVIGLQTHHVEEVVEKLLSESAS